MIHAVMAVSTSLFVLLSFISSGLSGVSMVYFVLFLLDWVPHSFSSVSRVGVLSPVIVSWSPLLNNLVLVSLFCLFHSLLARPSIKAAINSTLGTVDKQFSTIFAITASVLLLLISLCWQPMTHITLWSVERWPLLQAIVKSVCVLSWLLGGLAVLSINRFQLCGGEIMAEFLFGEQKWFRVQGGLVTSGVYGLVRHPAMFFLILGLWITPVMSIGHLLIAVFMTAYVTLAVHYFEEPQLIKEFGDNYKTYMKKVPYQVIPCIK
uniref:Nuclear envelope membrane protein n=2 Tax=Amphimedon queenslandica TaxID=400682 RepID=A0A1X7VBF7_AMPQE